ncbi:hypothetical protein A6J48_11325 [Neisseria meningitidis]|nr:hypothetical protein A6J48_11325 [Neisseria meningitidis]
MDRTWFCIRSTSFASSRYSKRCSMLLMMYPRESVKMRHYIKPRFGRGFVCLQRLRTGSRKWMRIKSRIGKNVWKTCVRRAV